MERNAGGGGAIVKSWRLTLTEKNGNGRKNSIYLVAETETEARDHFENHYSRFNRLLKITDISHTQKGKQLLSNADSDDFNESDHPYIPTM